MSSLPVPTEQINPELSLGDILAYSGLIGKLTSAFVALKGTSPGGVVELPGIDTWLPGLGEWGLAITATRKK